MAQDLIDVVEGNRIYIPAVYVLNKIDALTLEELELLGDVPNYCPISSHREWNLDGSCPIILLTPSSSSPRLIYNLLF